MRVHQNRWRAVRKKLLIGLLVLLVLAGLVAAVAYVLRNTNPIPKELRSSLTFSPLVVPEGTEGIQTKDYAFSTAENNVQILSYVISTSGVDVTVSEYVQPSEFTDIPEYKDRFLTNVIQQYETVQTSNGAIYLGKLSKQSDQQIGVMLEKGLIVFMRPDSSIDTVLWRKIGDQFSVQKLN